MYDFFGIMTHVLCNMYEHLPRTITLLVRSSEQSHKNNSKLSSQLKQI